MDRTARLIDGLLMLKSADEARRFLRDLMTESELSEFGKRFAAAELLDDGVPYSDIVGQTGLSTTTVARVSKWLQSEGGGYRLVLHRLHRPHKKSLSKSRR